MVNNSQKRFSNRVSDYVKFRPKYPEALFEFMMKELDLGTKSLVADIGSGTGIFTQQLLDHGATVFAVEPNAEMRAAAEEMLRDYPNFRSIANSAEATGLPPSSVDLVCAAQAFHWFDVFLVKKEWQRILRPGGKVCLVWNDRKDATTPFLTAYEDLLMKFGTDYNEVRHRNTEENGSIEKLFAPKTYRTFHCDNEQVFDFDGLKGRLLSSSYAPAHGHPNYEPMIAELRVIFDRHQVGGHVKFEYDTKAYYGEIGGVA